MAYSNFTLDLVKTEFQIEIVEPTNLFSHIAPVAPSAHLTAELARNVPVALAIGTEKAKSEMIVGDVLLELREHFNRHISLFSGIDFSVDAEKGLTGVCDFLISLSPVPFVLEAPIIVLVEAGFNSKFQLASCAERDALLEGLGQCVAEMLAAQQFNAAKGNDIPCVYGATTTGADWRFLKLEERRLHIDMDVYRIAQCDKILGILSSMVKQKA